MISLGTAGLPPTAGTFVGRTDELARLGALWSTASAGSTQLAVVRGEPGVGKTALATMFAREVIANGDVAFYGRCDEGVSFPYQPFVEIVRALNDFRPDALAELTSGTRARLAQLVPDLFAPIELVTELDPSAHREQLLRAVADLMRQQASSGPVLLVLDDLQWATASTLILLRHLVRDGDAVPMLVLALHRDTDLAPRHLLLDVLAELQVDGVVSRLPLTGLGVDEVRRVVEAAGVLRGAEAAALARRLVARTDGNPYFVGELLAAITADEDPTLELPASLLDVVNARIARLSPVALDLVQVLAVRGRPIEAQRLSHVLGCADDVALNALDEALATGLITETRGGDAAFTHDLVRDAVYRQPTAPRRARLHRRLADALDDANDDALAGEVAHHLAVSMPDDATKQRLAAVALRAGRHALGCYDPEAAAKLLRDALGALDALGGGEPGARSEVLLWLARALQRSGETAAARELCVEAAAIARQRADVVGLAAAALAFEEAAWTGEGFVMEPAAEGADELLHEAIVALGDTDLELRGRLLARLPRVLCFREPAAAREVFAAEARSLAAATGSTLLHGEALESSRWALWGSDDIEAALAVSDDLVVAASEADDVLLLTRANIWRYLALLELGDLRGVDGAIGTLHVLGERYRDPMAQWFPVMARAMQALLAGDLDAAERHAADALAVAQRLELHWAVTNFGIQLSYIRREQGRLDELEQATAGVAARFDAPVWNAALADLYCVCGRPEEARPLFERLAAMAFRDIPQDPGWLVTITMLADVCVALADVDRGEVLYALLAPHAGRVVVIGPGVVCAGSAALAAGRLAVLIGRLDEADEHLAEALRANTALGAVPALARTRAALQELATRRS